MSARLQDRSASCDSRPDILCQLRFPNTASVRPPGVEGDLVGIVSNPCANPLTMVTPLAASPPTKACTAHARKPGPPRAYNAPMPFRPAAKSSPRTLEHRWRIENRT